MAVFLAGFSPLRMTLLGESEPYAAAVSIVSASFFDTLGVRAQIGRTFLTDDGSPGTPNVVVISHAFWSRYFGADPSVVGTDITLDGNLNTNGAETFTVVGVAESGFQFPHEAEIWFLAQDSLRNIYRNLPFFDEHKSWFGVFWVVGRLKENARPEEARSELDVIVNRLAAETDKPHESLHVVLTPFVDHFLGANGSSLNFPVKSPHGSPSSVKLLIPPA